MTAANINPTLMQQWINDRLDTEKIREQLLDLGFNDDAIAGYISEFKKLKYGKKQTRGFIAMAVGAFLGFISCVLTIINPVPELYGLVLYGLTSVAVLIIFLGLYWVFE